NGTNVGLQCAAEQSRAASGVRANWHNASGTCTGVATEESDLRRALPVANARANGAEHGKQRRPGLPRPAYASSSEKKRGSKPRANETARRALSVAAHERSPR